MSITTLAEAKLHLRVDGTAEDSAIQIYLNAAEKSISNYLGRVLYATSAGTDTTGLVMDDAIKSAVLLQTAMIYENRDPKEVAQVQGLQMPNVIKWLLDPYRLGMGV
jgi:hypothetical protein